jgi:hypothetical protein
MAGSRVRSRAASVVGWIVVAVILYLAFGFVIGTIRWILRFVIVIVMIGALLVLYFKLRGDDKRDD